MIRLLLLLLPLFLIACGDDPTPLREAVAEIKTELAPDSRTDRVEVLIEGNVARGYTTIPEAFERLRATFADYPNYETRVRLLPDTSVGRKPYGIVNVSVANLRSQRGHSQELASQALLGTPLELLDREEDWFLVRTPDRYIAWVERGAITPATAAEMEDWYGGDLFFYQLPYAETTTEPDGGGEVIADPVMGSLVKKVGVQGAWTQVQLPSGEAGYNRSVMLRPASSWMQPSGLEVDSLLESARKLSGRPYLWGGTSAKGMDCSGFTKMAYHINGYLIPRDASQQVHAGEEVPLDDDLSAVRRGDLLFFGTLREDGSQRITHVGFYLGEGRLLHSGADNGRITEDNLMEGKPGFNAERRSSLLRAKRLSPGTPGVQTIAEAFAGLYTKSSSR